MYIISTHYIYICTVYIKREDEITHNISSKIKSQNNPRNPKTTLKILVLRQPQLDQPHRNSCQKKNSWIRREVNHKIKRISRWRGADEDDCYA